MQFDPPKNVLAGSGGLIVKVYISQTWDHGFKPHMVKTIFPYLIPVLIGSRKLNLSEL